MQLLLELRSQLAVVRSLDSGLDLRFGQSLRSSPTEGVEDKMKQHFVRIRWEPCGLNRHLHISHRPEVFRAVLVMHHFDSIGPEKSSVGIDD